MAGLPPLTPAYIMVALLWLSLAAFAILGGADFGAGVWDLLEWGSTAERARELLIRAIGPIWEANEIWLIFLITGTFTAFPIVFAALSIALFIPGVLALLGTVLRGAAFAYYSHFRAAVPVNLAWGRTFSVSSIIAPFFFGTMAAAVAGGHIRVVQGQVHTDFFSTWTAPFALACGAFAVAMCAVLAATYMTVEARNVGQQDLVTLFRSHALIAYLVTAVIGALAALLATRDAPYLWTNLTGRALPLVIATMLLGIATALMLLINYFALARVLIAGTIMGIFAAWGVAQYPYLIVPDVTVANASAPHNVLVAVVISAIGGLIIVLPALWLLFYLFKAKDLPQPAVNTEAWIETLPPTPDHAVGNASEHAAAPRPQRTEPVRHLGARLVRGAIAFGVALAFFLVGRLGQRQRLRQPH
jgi:cytochrome d ubiquinol oxidase subunit II